jgi:hypothetical protein
VRDPEPSLLPPFPGIPLHLADNVSTKTRSDSPKTASAARNETEIVIVEDPSALPFPGLPLHTVDPYDFIMSAHFRIVDNFATR